MFKSSFNGEVFRESYEDYLKTKAPMQDISYQIYNTVFGTNSLKESPLDKDKYGNESFRNFLLKPWLNIGNWILRSSMS